VEARAGVIMHELSIAQSLIDTLTEMIVRQNLTRIETATIEVGELSGVVPSALRSAFMIARQGTELSATTLEIVPVTVEIDCAVCGKIRFASAASDVRCTICGTPSMSVIRGRELDIVRLKVCDDPKNPGNPHRHPERE